MFLNSVEPYRQPETSRIHLLNGVNLQSSLSFDEIMDITNSPYTDESWIRLAYFVSKGQLRRYRNDDIGRIVDRNITRGNWKINGMPVNCIVNETYLRMPSVCDWTRHFLFFMPDDFLGSLEVFSLQLSNDLSEFMALNQIAKLAQYQLVSNSPFNRFIVAIQKENNWEIAFGEIPSVITPKSYTKTRRVKITLFKEPNKLFQELLIGNKTNNLLYDRYEFRVRVDY